MMASDLRDAGRMGWCVLLPVDHAMTTGKRLNCYVLLSAGWKLSSCPPPQAESRNIEISSTIHLVRKRAVTMKTPFILETLKLVYFT